MTFDDARTELAEKETTHKARGHTGQRGVRSELDSLNYNHLYYFWMVAREGSIVAASRVLHVSQPTISGQIRLLEHNLGTNLFERVGRGLALTDPGRIAYRYADEIFANGRELLDALRRGDRKRPLRLAVGVAHVVPKLIAHQLLRPSRELDVPVRLTCIEDRPEKLAAELTVREIDVVLSDTPVTRQTGVRLRNDLLLECGLSFFANRDDARELAREFPGSLDGAPFLLPVHGSAVRRPLDLWFEERGVRPQVVAEFDDSALLKVFGGAGDGVFCAPSVIEEAVCNLYGARGVGRTDEIVERFYAISVEREVEHPGVAAIRQPR
jgi:LysR family transcriptional activator of nhaA